MNFLQTDQIRDFIFPLIKSKRNSETGGYIYRQLIGTGFFIGSQGFAMTAGHVIDQLLENHNSKIDAINILLQKDTHWLAFEINKYEKHPSEDVGIISISNNQKWHSIMRLTREPQYSSCEYDCWGYPHDIAKELQLLEENALERPELLYTQGYVRRRISRELFPTMIFKGKNYYELSETVGGGNSGGPVILKRSRGNPKWDVFAIYIGESDKVGYAVRTEAFVDWIPKILGKSVFDESNNGS